MFVCVSADVFPDLPGCWDLLGQSGASGPGCPDQELGGQNRLEPASAQRARSILEPSAPSQKQFQEPVACPRGCSLILPAASKAIGADGNLPDVKPSCAN